MGEHSGGFVLDCLLDGRITAIIYQNCGIDEAGAIGVPFVTLIQREDLHKALNFFAALRRNGAEFDWEMTVPLTGRPATMHFSGVVDRDRLLVVASRTGQAISGLFEEMQRINNEHVSQVRQIFKQRANAPIQLEASDGFEDMMRLNNEFANIQRELSKKNAALQELNRRKSMLLGVTAHDLRNPLGVISGFAQMLELMLSKRLTETELSFVRNIRESSIFMLKIVEDLVDYSDADLGEVKLNREQTNLIELVRNSVRLNSVIAGRKGIELVADLTDQKIVIEIDRRKIDQVLNNLISNAIKYSHIDTVVRIEVLPSPDQVAVAIIDQGQGIPEHDIPNLFQPFRRAAVQPTGGESSTGLGLAICKSIVEAHGGQITVESRVGFGSIFRFFLPSVGAADGDG